MPIQTSYSSTARNQARRRFGFFGNFRAVAAVVLLSATALFGQDEPKTTDSPNNAFFAAVRSMPDANYIWKADMDGFRLVVMRRKSPNELDDVYFKGDVPARAVARFQWSPDSKFLVMTTVSSDGHSPWHFTTFVFSVADKSLRRMDDQMDPITSEEFRFEPPSTVIVRVRDYSSEFGKAGASKPRRIPLHQAFQKMHKLD